jgi:transposase-like protein
MAKQFFRPGYRGNGVPGQVAMDVRSASNAAIDVISAGGAVLVMVRPVKSIHNIAEHVYRTVTRIGRPMLNIKSFCRTGDMISSVELMHMLHKSLFAIDDADAVSFADQCYALEERSCEV